MTAQPLHPDTVGTILIVGESRGLGLLAMADRISDEEVGVHWHGARRFGRTKHATNWRTSIRAVSKIETLEHNETRSDRGVLPRTSLRVRQFDVLS